MAFNDTGLIFLVANSDGTNRRVLFAQTNACALAYGGVNTLVEDGAGDWRINSATLNAVAVAPTFARRAFKARPNSVGSVNGTVRVDLNELEAMLAEGGAAAAFRNTLIDGFIGGGAITLNLGSSGPDEALVVELRALETADFVLLEASGEGKATPAHHITTSTANLVLSGADVLANYSFHLAEGFTGGFAPTGTYQRAVTADAAGVLTIDSGYHAPPDSATRNLRLRIQHLATSKASILPIDLHVPTDVIVSFDRSGSMQAFIDGSTTLRKWNAAESVGNLFSTLFGTLLPNLSSPNGTIAAQNRTLLTKWFASGGTQLQHDPSSGNLTASTSPPQFSAATAGGATPIGDALNDAVARFAAQSSNSKWRRRHIILLTDGMHNSGSALTGVTLPLPMADGSDSTGIVLHTVQYAVGTEAFNPHLNTLRNNSGGQNHDSSADTDPLNSDVLLEMYLNLLASILPVNVAVAAAGEVTIPVEDGIERAAFVATNVGTLTLTNGTQSTGGGSSGNGLTWTFADRPATGPWTISATPGGAVLGLYDLALRFRCGAEPAGLGQPIRLWAEIRHRGEPVSGADVRVGSRRPSESVGELLTGFVRSGGLLKAVRRGQLQDLLFTRVVDANAGSSAQSGDSPSVQSQLLKVAERWRNLPLQFSGDAVTLVEVAPGRYEGTVPASATENEYVRNFYFRADGTTPGGSSFARDARTSVMLDPVPDPARSDTSLVAQTPSGGSTVTYTATVLPRTATGKPAGPGLGHYFFFQYLDPKDQKALPPLVTVDKLDGVYAVDMVVEKGVRPPAVGLFARTQTASGKPSVVPIHPDEPSRGKVRRVKVVLQRVQVLDDKDGWLTGKGEVAFDAVVAPNSNPHRAVRTRIPKKGIVKVTSGQTIPFDDEVLYEGLVEEGASLSVTLGGTEFDYLLFFKRQEKLARYHRKVELWPGTQQFSPDDEPNDPESLRDWRVWYAVEVR